MSHSRFPAAAALASVAVLAMSAATLAAEYAVVTQDSYVYKSRSTSSQKVNTVEEGQEVLVTDCQGTYCFLNIPGPNGWIKKSRLAPLDDDGDPVTDVPFSFGLTFGPGGPSVSIGIGDAPPPAPPGPGPAVGARACFFQHTGYAGASFCVAAGDSISNLTSIGWNDKISSVRLYGGAGVQVCEHTGYGGACVTWNANKSSLGGWNDRISSVDVY